MTCHRTRAPLWEATLMALLMLVAASSVLAQDWTTVDVGTAVDLYSFFQPSLGQFWTGGQSGVVRRKINGAWEVRDIPSGETFAIFTRSRGQAWAVGSSGSIYKTTNGGDD